MKETTVTLNVPFYLKDHKYFFSENQVGKLSRKFSYSVQPGNEHLILTPDLSVEFGGRHNRDLVSITNDK